MKLKNPELFEQLILEYALDDDRRAVLTAIGVDPRDWPPCQATRVATGFLDAEKAKGTAYARFQFAKHLEELNGCELPADSSELKAFYDDVMNWNHTMSLAEKLTRDPARADQLIREFQTRRTSAVGSFVLNDSIMSWIDRLHVKVEQGTARVEIPQWKRLSHAIGGFNPGRFSMFVAGTGVGKTAATMAIAHSAAEKFDVLVINMEMGKDDMIARCVASGTGQTFDEIVTGKIDFEKLGPYVEKLNVRSKIEITDGRALTLDQIKAKAYITKQQRPELALIFIDYDQKIRLDYSSSKGDMDREWKALVKAAEDLEELAKVTDTHVCLLAQGNDDGDPKASKRSKQPAATVLHFYKDGDHHVIEAVKNRFGETGAKVLVRFDGSRSQVRELHETEIRRGGKVTL